MTDPNELTPEDFEFTSKGARVQLLNMECGEAYMNDNTVLRSYKGDDNFIPGMITSEGRLVRPPRSEIRTKDGLTPDDPIKELVAPIPAIKLNIQTLTVDEHGNPTETHFNQQAVDAVAAFRDQVVGLLRRHNVPLKEIKIPGGDRTSPVFEIDEYHRTQDRNEKTMSNHGKDFKVAEKLGYQAANRHSVGKNTFQFLIPTDLTEPQQKALAAAIGEINRTVEHARKR